MRFDWHGYFQLAEELLNSVTDPILKGDLSVPPEAKARSSISRAYYSAFCAAKIHLGMRDRKDANIHRVVIQELLDSSDQKLKKVGTALERLRDTRNFADYRDECMHHHISQTKRAINDAKFIKEELAKNKLKN